MDDRVCHRSLGTARRALTQSEEQGMSEASEGAKVRNISRWECSGGPVLKDPPFSAGDAGSIKLQSPHAPTCHSEDPACHSEDPACHSEDPACRN